ncbi:hypothetical protein RHGRI_038927 [Rhododendron griersonianum]|uniref:Uncharacterized protein n=1 Tax=Rhododendron griersonianum TaxID=479676 RepID=A0AAV6HND7_9ERIC|nr:hypothetical protein RHGRI_038927 [Rhododendron griersonianum]
MSLRRVLLNLSPPRFADPPCRKIWDAGQAALKAYDKAAKVSAERERYRTDRDNFRAKFKISETQLQETDAEVERLKKELTEARTAASTAEAEVEKMKKEEREKPTPRDMKLESKEQLWNILRRPIRW